MARCSGQGIGRARSLSPIIHFKVNSPSFVLIVGFTKFFVICGLPPQGRAQPKAFGSKAMTVAKVMGTA